MGNSNTGQEDFLVQITIKSSSRRNAFSSLLTSMMSLTASVIAEPLVPASFPGFGMRPSEGNHSPAVLASDKVAARSQDPVHLQVHRPEEIIEMPVQLHGGGVRLGHTVDVYADALPTGFPYYRVDSKGTRHQGALRGRDCWELPIEHTEVFLKHVVHMRVIGQEASGRVLISIQD